MGEMRYDILKVVSIYDVCFREGLKIKESQRND